MADAEVKITIMVERVNADDEFAEMQLSVDTDIDTLKLIIEGQLGVPVAEQTLICKNATLTSGQTLGSAGVATNDIITVRLPSAGPPAGVNPYAVGGPASGGMFGGGGGFSFGPNADLRASYPPWLNMTPQQLRDQIVNSPGMLQRLTQRNPAMGEAILAGDLGVLTQILNTQREMYARSLRQEQIRRQQINDDPFNVEAQRAIEQEIQQQNVQQNLETAMENMPEAFGRVVMLYVPMTVEGVQINAFVDSGAQMTIMSRQLAERCNLSRLIDHRWRGVAKGVGTADIVGRIHIAQVKFGNLFLPCSFTIMEDPNMEFLFGLDMLRRHQGVIDLQNNALRIGEEAVPFLQEKDIPHLAQQNLEDLQRTAELEEKQQAEQRALEEQIRQQLGGGNGGGGAPAPEPEPSSAAATAATDVPMPDATSATAPASSGGAGLFGGFGAPPRPAATFPEESIAAVMNVGASREDAIRALQACGGNAELAANLIFQQMGGFGF